MKIFWILEINFKNLSFLTTFIMAFNEIFIKLRYILNHLKLSQGRRHQGDALHPQSPPPPQPPPAPPPLFCVAKRKKGDESQKEKVSKQKLLNGCYQGQNIIVLAIEFV